MLKNSIIIMFAAVLASACVAEDANDPIEETIDNLLEAGFPEDDIQIYDGEVYVGHDTHVSLEASREMQGGEEVDLETIQYRTRNLVSPSIKTICILDLLPSGNLKNGLTGAINNYNALGLRFKFKRGVGIGCDAQIQAQITWGTGAHAGFPENGRPYGSINIGLGIASQHAPAVATHVITHELGHTIGFRHSDFYDRSISCPSKGGNEGDAGIGAIHIPGTPTSAAYNGSLMNSCYNSGSTGVFTSSDVTALRSVY